MELTQHPQAQEECAILTAVQRLVESNYVNGIPRHHLPSARNVQFEEGASMFFIVDFTDFVKLKPVQIHEIYRHRNILVRNIPERGFDWSLETLSEVGALKRPREIQGLSELPKNWLFH
jgi:hypothetical protein